jgi:hypothetical protein
MLPAVSLCGNVACTPHIADLSSFLGFLDQLLLQVILIVHFSPLFGMVKQN